MKSLLCWLASAALTAGSNAATAPASGVEKITPGYLRVVAERDSRVALEIAARSFAPTDGLGPAVTLVGVSHLGERELYDAVQELLAEHDVVLYESVKPAGAIRPGGTNDEEKRASTLEAMRFAAGVIEASRRDGGAVATDLDAVRSFARGTDARLEQFVADAIIDGWNRMLNYAPESDSYRLTSFGADGKPGGEGADADLTIAPGSEGPSPYQLELTGDGGIQADLARSLGLRFQLSALNYDQPNWRCSDMTMSQLEAALGRQGADLAPLSDALAGSSLPAKIAKFMLGLVRLLDSLTQGASTDLLKIMLIEMLGNEAMIDQALQQFDPAFARVIVEDRNQVVIDEIKLMMQREPAAKRVAVLYGAAHMPDMAERLAEQMNYAETGDAIWMTAIEVDLRSTKLPPSDVRQMRLMLRQTLRQQLDALPRR